jgi:hypothetical protein
MLARLVTEGSVRSSVHRDQPHLLCEGRTGQLSSPLDLLHATTLGGSVMPSRQSSSRGKLSGWAMLLPANPPLQPPSWRERGEIQANE